jgi:hypothetical protein
MRGHPSPQEDCPRQWPASRIESVRDARLGACRIEQMFHRAWLFGVPRAQRPPFGPTLALPRLRRPWRAGSERIAGSQPAQHLLHAGPGAAVAPLGGGGR